MTMAPSFSIVICTDARLAYLKATLESLLFLRRDDFEVCVVCGPTEDGTAEYVAGFGRGVKIARCDRRNLSVARNIGIATAAGDIVAFLDDDAIPEPEWLDDLDQSYADPWVGAAGGFVYDNTGLKFQTKYVTINRTGYPARILVRTGAASEFSLFAGISASARRQLFVPARRLAGTGRVRRGIRVFSRRDRPDAVASMTRARIDQRPARSCITNSRRVRCATSDGSFRIGTR